MKKIFLILALVGLLFSGCKDDFLDLYPTTDIDENAAFSTPDNAMAVLYGIYDGVTGSNSCGSYLFITNEARADDAFTAQALNWNFWVETFNYTWIPSSTRRGSPKIHWDQFYSVIEDCNAGINADLPFAGEPLDEYLSELYIIRALSYYNLVTIFCAPYNSPGGPASPGVPVYTVSDFSSFKGRGTVQDVYDLIEADLAFATTKAALQGNDYGKTRFTRCFANGLAARVALSKADYGAAYTYTMAALADAPPINTNIPDYSKGFSHDNEEAIFIVPFNSDDYPIYIGLTSFYDHPEGYGNIFFTKDLFDMYAADDVRKNWFVTPLFYNFGDPAANAHYGDLIYDSYHFDGGYSYGRDEIADTLAAGTIVTGTDFYPDNLDSWVHYRPGHYSLYAKFPREDAVPGVSRGSVGLGQPPLMRTSELVLIKAECEARGEGGGEAAAQATLHSIQVRAQPSAVQTTSTGATLIDEVLLERRKELAGEGFRMLDILRLGQPLVRPNIQGPNWSDVMSLPAWDPRMIYPIPEAEIDANDQITNAEQNPGYN